MNYGIIFQGNKHSHQEFPEGEEKEKWFPEEEKEKGEETLFKELIAEKLPNLGKDVDIQVPETQRTLSNINPPKRWPQYTLQ